MLLVLAFTIPVVSIWGLANQQAMSLLRLKHALDAAFELRGEQALTDADFRLAALACGMALLETGVPPAEVLEGKPETYRCKVQIRAPAGVEAIWMLTFRVGNRNEGNGTERWTLLASPWDPVVYPDLGWPVSFVPLEPAA